MRASSKDRRGGGGQRRSWWWRWSTSSRVASTGRRLDAAAMSPGRWRLGSATPADTVGNRRPRLPEPRRPVARRHRDLPPPSARRPPPPSWRPHVSPTPVVPVMPVDHRARPRSRSGSCRRRARSPSAPRAPPPAVATGGGRRSPPPALRGRDTRDNARGASVPPPRARRWWPHQRPGRPDGHAPPGCGPRPPALRGRPLADRHAPAATAPRRRCCWARPRGRPRGAAGCPRCRRTR